MRVEKSIDGCVVKDSSGRVLARGQVEAQVRKQALDVLRAETEEKPVSRSSSKKRKSRRKKTAKESSA